MVTIEGTVTIGNMPPHRAAMVSLSFYAVSGAESPPPYGGDPPADAYDQSVEVCSESPSETDFCEPHRSWHFAAETATGYYYVQLRVVLYREQDGRMFAQCEQFFFRRRPLHVPEDGVSDVAFPVTWPELALEDLHQYGIVSPRRPWWRFR